MAFMFNRLGLRAAVAALAAAPLIALAADAPATAPATLPSSPLNLLLGLGFLLALVGVAWWLVRRMGGLQVAGSRAPMRVLGSLPVGARERVVLVQVGEQQLLLGVAPGRVNLLLRLEEPLTLEGGNEFADRMRQVLQQGLGR